MPWMLYPGLHGRVDGVALHCDVLCVNIYGVGGVCALLHPVGTQDEYRSDTLPETETGLMDTSGCVGLVNVTF